MKKLVDEKTPYRGYLIRESDKIWKVNLIS